MLVALSLTVVSFGTASINNNLASAHTPDCPSSIPTADGESFWTDSDGDRWFIVRQSDSSGYTTVQAYVASDDYDIGCIATSPHETCVLKVRGPDDEVDLNPPVPIFIRNDDDDDPATETRVPSATYSLSETSGSTETTESTETSESTETTGVANIGVASFVYQGTEVTILIAFADLESDSDATTVDYRFRVRVMQGQTINLLCQGTGMNIIRKVTTNAGSTIQTATIPGTCPVGTYTIEVELADGDDTTISNPIATGTGYLVIGPQPQSQQSGQGGNGQGNGGGGTNNGGTTTVIVSECGDGAQGSTGTPGRPDAPTLILTQDTTLVGVQWTAPINNGSEILGYAIMYTREGGTSTEMGAGGLSEILTGLAPDATYEIRVAACNSVGFGHWSPGATLDTATTVSTSGGNTVGNTNNAWCGIAAQGSAGTPSAPNPPVVTADGADSITVTWGDAGPEILIYTVQYTPGIMIKETGLTRTITGLAAQTSYSVVLATCNAVGMSAWSPAVIVQTDPASSNPEEDDFHSTTTVDGDGTDYDIDILGRCGVGLWEGHTHQNNTEFWGGTVGCLEESLINSIDPAPRGRMWTKDMMDDHKHPGFSDETHGSNSCNSQHTTAHANHGVLPCSSQ